MIIDGITTPSGVVIDVSELDSLDSSNQSGLIQMKNTTYTGTHSDSVGTNIRTGILNMSVSITPKFIDSKMLVQVQWNGEHSTINGHNSVFSLFRNGVDIGAPASGSRNTGIAMVTQGYYADDNNSTMESAKFHHVDEHGTLSIVTYQLSIITSNACTLYTNRTVDSLDDPSRERTVSSITVMEIAA